jgi:hypothetical protein
MLTLISTYHHYFFMVIKKLILYKTYFNRLEIRNYNMDIKWVFQLLHHDPCTFTFYIMLMSKLRKPQIFKRCLNKLRRLVLKQALCYHVFICKHIIFLSSLCYYHLGCKSL